MMLSVLGTLPVFVHVTAEAGSGHRVVVNRQMADVSTAVNNREPYLQLRALAEKLGGHLSWDARRRQAMLIRPGGRKFIVNGFVEDGRYMVGLPEIERLFGVEVYYDPARHMVVIDRSNLPCTAEIWERMPSFDGFSAEDWYWLSRIVHAEARGETFESRLAVANVVLNRVGHPSYPGTVREVIFDRRHGIQFTPTANGAINLEPNAVSRLAALDALEGTNNAPGALFFINPRYATNFWVPNNREYAFTIGSHQYFY